MFPNLKRRKRKRRRQFAGVRNKQDNGGELEHVRCINNILSTTLARVCVCIARDPKLMKIKKVSSGTRVR